MHMLVGEQEVVDAVFAWPPLVDGGVVPGDVSQLTNDVSIVPLLRHHHKSPVVTFATR